MAKAELTGPLCKLDQVGDVFKQTGDWWGERVIEAGEADGEDGVRTEQ